MRTLPVMSTDPGTGPTGGAPTVVPPEVACGFCERVAAPGVVRVVAGPSLYICERCVDDALEAFQDVPPRASADAAAGAATAADGCGFCHRFAPPDRLWRGRGTVQADAHDGVSVVCDECVELCVETLAEG